MSPALRVEDLSVDIQRHGDPMHVVKGLSLEVEPGRAMGLVGESGSGKSISLRAILGLLPQTASITGGHVWIDGEDVTNASKRRRRALHGPVISMIFQEPMSALNPVMRVGEQIGEGPRTHLGLSRTQAAVRAIDLMRKVGIPDAERRGRDFPHQFSGGMRQRVMIAMALSCEPKVILCDEPTTALDVTIQDQILRLLAGLCAESGTALLFVTHDLPVVAQLCQAVAVMYAGRILEQGDVGEVFRLPQHPYTLGLLRSAPDFGEARAGLVPIPGSPPELSSPPSGCVFHPRCAFATDDCASGELPLVEVGGRLTACRHHERAVAAQLEMPVMQ
jgi:peptide/nickel transport system ATP-binding protein/oligopeptide transport system ATP-binding protein